MSKNILIIGPAHPLRGGLATFNERLARAFQSEGHTVNIVTFYVTIYRAEYAVAAILAAFNLFLLWSYRGDLRPLFTE